MIDPVGTRSQARVPRDSWLTPRNIEHGPEAPETAAQPRALGPGPESPGTAGQTHGPLDSTAFARDSCLPHGLSDTDPRPSEILVKPTLPRVQSPFAEDRWSTPRALGHGPELPRTPVRQRGMSYQGRIRPGQLVDHGHSDPDQSHLGQLVNPAGPRTLLRVVLDSWSTPRAL